VLVCFRVTDAKVPMLYMTNSPARTIVQDVERDMFALTLDSPRGPMQAFSYSAAPCGMLSMRYGNLTILPDNLDPAIRKQYPVFPTYVPVRRVKRYVHIRQKACCVYACTYS
jgi:hypothetical protein